ncbi:unnamed protein product [Thlaspi arvense]|uniref:BHLH domain-containing protein n=1 Tax=Thlaspi arvense TaxID=13288 RepID=A0AAU9SGF2_THLAR|nr:unnamed protein product [Thlaspi arvense]
MNHGTASADVASPRGGVSGIHGLGMGQTYGVHALFQHLPPRFGSLLSPLNPHVKGELYASNALHEATQKRFAIFDQSGNNTRLFLSPLCYPVKNLTPGLSKSLNAHGFHDEGQTAKVELKFQPSQLSKRSLMRLKNNGEGSEMHENTEEINALLYSDDDDGGDDDDDDDGGGGDSEEDEVTSTDGAVKRQRLIDGEHNRSSFTSMVNSGQLDGLCNYDGDAQSISARCKKDKIRKTLKVLESLIPGIKSKDPLLVIEEAISYLKYLKLNAKALGVV